jgi:hypothetical protein
VVAGISEEIGRGDGKEVTAGALAAELAEIIWYPKRLCGAVILIYLSRVNAFCRSRYWI